MKKLAALARKLGDQLVRRLGSTSISGKPVAGPVGRAAPRGGKLSAETRSTRVKVSPMPVKQDPLPGTAGRMASGEAKAQSASVDRLRRMARKATEERLKARKEVSKTTEAAVKATKAPSLAHGLSASAASAPSTSSTPPPPHRDSDFWFKIMMAGGAAVAFTIDLLKGYVEKEVNMKMKQREVDEKDRIIKEKDAEIAQTKNELKLTVKEQKTRGWFWQ